MSRLLGSYKDWATIDYQPFIAELHPHVILPYLTAETTALDVGCNKGGAALFLASHGLKVLGIDINSCAVDEARSRAESRGLEGRVTFEAADFLIDPPFGEFDIVLLARVLTCFPEAQEWRTLLSQAEQSVRLGGLLYVHDFLISLESENYRARYEAGEKRGWRPGNFCVNSPLGDELFVAHHHSDDEVRMIVSPYSPVFYNVHESMSMNGNPCRMFEFLGKRLA